MKKHLIVACPFRTGWAVSSVSARTKQELEGLAKEMLAEFLIWGWLDLPKCYPRLDLAYSYSRDNPRTEYLLSELFKRAEKMGGSDCEPYVIYIGTDPMELKVPHPSEIPWNQSPMDVAIRCLINEVKSILKEYDSARQ